MVHVAGEGGIGTRWLRGFIRSRDGTRDCCLGLCKIQPEGGAVDLGIKRMEILKNCGLF